jgi:hypothetical protein
VVDGWCRTIAYEPLAFGCWLTWRLMLKDMMCSKAEFNADALGCTRMYADRPCRGAGSVLGSREPIRNFV